MSLDQLIADLRSRGIAIRRASDMLHVDAPEGALTPELREQITNLKPQLLNLPYCRECGRWLLLPETQAAGVCLRHMGDEQRRQSFRSMGHRRRVERDWSAA